MLYFLYMSILLSNNLFHHSLTKGSTEYVNKYPFVVIENQMLESNTHNNYIVRLNYTLLEAQKYLLKRPKYIGFTFDASDNVVNVQDISRGTIGNAYFYETNSTLTTGTGRSAYLLKNNGMPESVFTETENQYYFGDLDYVKFTIPQTDVSNIKQTVIDLSSNLTLLSRFIPIQMLPEITHITIETLANDQVTVDYYLYVWEDINGPWFDGTSTSTTPNYTQLADANYNIRPITFNDISNQEQINQSDINGRNLYTYNFFNTNASDTSSNYVRVFKLTGVYGENDGVPQQNSIILPSPKYTKYNFLWTYSIKNSYKLKFTNNSNQTTEYLLEGSAPFYTPNINISGSSWKYDYFSNIGSLASHFSTLNVERIYKAIRPIDLSYNTGVLTLSIPEQDKYDISENFIKRYQPDNRQGNDYLINAIDGTKYIHLYEDNEILKIEYNIYIFTNETIQYGKTSTNTTVDLSNNSLTQNQTSYPYGDTFVDISYSEILELSDNAVYFKTINKSNINYGDVPYNGVNSSDVSRNRYNNEEDINGLSSQVNAQTTINADTIDKYFAYETNSILNVEILRVKRSDLINLPYYGHLESTGDWNTVYKFYNTLPSTSTLQYTMGSNNYSIRWNYNMLRYKYNKSSPVDFTQSYYEKTSFNSGISNVNEFDFTEFQKRVYPNKLLDISYTTLPHTTNNQVDFYYKNMNISLSETNLSLISTNLFFNHNENVRVKINIYVLKPNAINGIDQQNNYDTRDISYNLFDLSFSFYDSTRPVPQNVAFDISENNSENTLLSGQYIFEWDYEIINDGGVSAAYLPFNKRSIANGGEYEVNSTVFNVPYNDFLYDLSGVHVYSNANFTNLFLEFAQEDIERFVDYIKIFHKTLDASNTAITLKFSLFSPNSEASQSSGIFWELPPGYQGRDDPRLYQAPVTYFDKSVVPSPTLIYENVNRFKDVGFSIQNASYVNSINQFYKLTTTYDISNTTYLNINTDISDNYITDVKNYIVEMIIPDGEINAGDLSANWGIGSIENMTLQKIIDKVNGVHLGIVTDSSNNTIAYYKDGNPYYLDTKSGENITGKVRWMMQENGSDISVTVSVNNKKGIYLSNLGSSAASLNYVGTDISDISQNTSTIKIYDKRPDTNFISLQDISRTDIIFHQLTDPTIVGGTTTFPQSHDHTNSTFQIPYICRMDYNIHDKTNSFKFESVIRKGDNQLSNIYHRGADWDISYNVDVNGTTQYFFNETAATPFYHKYIYGVGFISPFDFEVIDYYYPGKLKLEYDSVRRRLILQINEDELTYLKFNMVNLWNAVNDNTRVRFRYYGWESKSPKMKNLGLVSGSLNPNLISDISNVITDLSGADFTVNNVDFMYDQTSNSYYEFNYPQIPQTLFIINEDNLRSGIYYIGWTYIVNNTWNTEKTPPTRSYDLSLATIIIPPFPYRPGNVNVEIKEDISQVKLFLPPQTLLDMSKNIYFKNFDYSDISEVKINYYLWTPNDIQTEDNSGGWILPDDYQGQTDMRIKEFPVIYYDETTKLNTFYDVSYNGGYGLDETKAYTKTVTGKNLTDMSSVVFSPSDFGLNELPYSSRYYKNGNMVPYIARWNYELVMETSSEYAGVSIQSDISNSSDSNYLFRNADWVINYDASNNASFQGSIYNKYLYNSAILIETIIPPPPPIVFNDYRCTDSGCAKTTTKTKEQKTFIQRYASLFNGDFRTASKIQFDCNKKS